nr:dentin sialophosphoprotein isoform X2 [Helicoverpa armigera]
MNCNVFSLFQLLQYRAKTHQKVTMRGITSIEINSDYEEISNDAPSSTDNSDNEGVNHEANGDSDNADNESSNDNSPALNAVRHPNYNVVNVPNNDIDANNAEHDSENEEEEGARSDSQRLEYDWNYAEQDSISDSDDYDWNFGYEEDQAGATNSSQNTNTTTQTTNAEKDDKGGPSNSGNQDSASANPENADKNDSKSGKPEEPDEPGDTANASSQSRKPDDLAEMEDDNLKLFHSLELDETKNAQAEGRSSADDPSSDDNETTSDENKMSNDAADTSEMTFGSFSYDCGRGAIRRTGQSSNRDRDIFTPITRTTIRKPNQNAYRRSPFENSDEYSMRGYQSIQQDFNYADYINVCASSFTESDPVEGDNFSGYRSPNLSRYGNLNSPGFGDSGEHSYETERSAVHEAPANPEHGTNQTPAYSTSGTGNSGGDNQTSLSSSNPVSPSHGIQHASSEFNTPGYDGPGIGLGLQAKIDEILKSADKAKKSDSNRVLLEVSDTPPFSFDFQLDQRADNEYRGYAIIQEITAHLNEEARRSPVPGPGYGRGRAAGRGRSAVFGPLQDIGNTHAQRGPRRPLIEVIGGTDFEVEIEPRRGRGRGRGRRGTNGN